MRRYIGSHAHGNAGGAIDKQVGHPRWHDCRYALSAVVVVDEIYRFLVKIRQYGVGDLAHTDLGVTHGGGRVPVDRTEVTLSIHQHIAQ